MAAPKVTGASLWKNAAKTSATNTVAAPAAAPVTGASLWAAQGAPAAAPATVGVAGFAGGNVGGAGLWDTAEKIGETVLAGGTLGLAGGGYLPNTDHIAGQALDSVAKTTEGIGTGLYVLAKDSEVPQAIGAAVPPIELTKLLAENPGLISDPGKLAGAYGSDVKNAFVGKSTSGFQSNWEHPQSWLSASSINQDPFAKDVVQIGKNTVTSIVHPLRDPVQTAQSVAILASLGAGAVVKAAYAADAIGAVRSGEALTLNGEAATAGDVAKAGIRAVVDPRAKPPTSLRIIRQPTLNLVKPADGAEGPASVELGAKPVQLHASGNPLARAGQAAHDFVIQKALDNNVFKSEPSSLAKYAQGRLAGSVGEGTRILGNARASGLDTLAQAGVRGPIKALTGRSSFGAGVTQKGGNMALFLRSANVLPKEAADFWSGATGKIEPTKETLNLAKVAQRLDESGALRIGTHGNVEINAGQYPALAKADELTKAAQVAREDILSQHQLMSPEGMQARKNLVGNTMVSGFEGERQGDAYTSLKTMEKQAPQTDVAASRGNLIPLTKKLSVGKEATGMGLVKGLVPDNTIRGVASSLAEALRYHNTTEFRGQVAALGSDVRNSGHDVLVADPNLHQMAGLPPEIEKILGRKKSTLDTLPGDEEEHAGLVQAMGARMQEAFPALDTKTGHFRDTGERLGTRAPQGYKWVPERLIPQEIRKAATARSGLAKKTDSLNSAVTAATVYLKLGHLPTRGFTNATTNIVQGSANPFEIRKSVELVKGLSDAEVHQLAAVTGTHGYQALPHAGTSFAAKVAGYGAGWWSKNIDAPFRLNAILHEFRQIGITTPDQVRAALKQISDPARSGMDAAKASRLDWAVRRANRESIMYDGLNDVEKRYLTRLFWFYPWTKGAARFAGHTIAEHPVKAFAADQVGQLGSQYQQQHLGAVPSYELGLTPLTGGSNPLTSNFSTFTPFSTVGQLAQVAKSPATAVQQFNPVWAGALKAGADAVEGKGATKAVKDFGAQAFAPTPELQGITAALHPQGHGLFPTSTQRMFGSSGLSALARALVGAGFPRHTNVSQLAKDAARENMRKRTITIYGG